MKKSELLEDIIYKLAKALPLTKKEEREVKRILL